MAARGPRAACEAPGSSPRAPRSRRARSRTHPECRSARLADTGTCGTCVDASTLRAANAQTDAGPDDGAWPCPPVLWPGLLAATGLGHERHEDRPPRRSRRRSWVRWPRCGRRRSTSGRSRARSTAATCGRWARSSRRSTSIGLEPVGGAPRLAGAAVRRSPRWGMLRLLDVIVGRPRGLPHLLGAGFYLLNPYTVDLQRPHQRGAARLRGAALAAARGAPRRAGGARLARLARLVVGGRLRARAHLDRRRHQRRGGGLDARRARSCCLIYEPLIGAVRWRDSAGFLVRIGVLGTLASLWWIVPLVVHAGYGIDFLQFTEQPRSIWGTNSAPEALRLMAYWTSYIGVGFYGAEQAALQRGRHAALQPARWWAPRCCCRRWRWPASRWTRRLALRALPAPAAARGGGDRGGRLSQRHARPATRWSGSTATCRCCASCAPPRRRRRSWRWAWAGLLALGAQVALARLRALAARPGCAAPGRSRSRRAGGADRCSPRCRSCAAPRSRSSSPGSGFPAPGRAPGATSTASCRANSRALVLPGQIFANYTWGGTIDAILPRVTERPVAVRYETPYWRPARHRPAVDGRPARAAAPPAARPARSAAAA